MANPFIFGELAFDQERHGWALELGYLLASWMVGYAWQGDNASDLENERSRSEEAKLGIEGRLREHNISDYHLPECSDRHNPTYGGPEHRAATSQYAVVQRIKGTWSIEHAAFTLIGQAANMLGHTEDITPQAAAKLNQRGSAAVEQLQIFCKSVFPDRILYDEILRKLASAKGKYPDIVELLLAARKPLVILLVLADPMYDIDRTTGQIRRIGGKLKLLEEQHTLQETLEAVGLKGRFEVEVLANAQPNNLGPKIDQFKPTIIQFSGHGDRQGIWFSDINRVARRIDSELLQRMLTEASRHNLQGVIMNSCYTAEAF